MKRLMTIALILVVFAIPSAARKSVGKIIQVIGETDIISLSDGKRIQPRVGQVIFTDHRIRTGKRSFVEILLEDGTKLLVNEVSVFKVSKLKTSESSPPTRINLLTGKLRVVCKEKIYKSRSLVVKTQTSIAGVRGTDFGVIAGRLETKIVVFNGTVDVANVNKRIIKSYVLNAREEVSIAKDREPTSPRVVPDGVLKTWFDRYELDSHERIIIKQKRDDSFIDKIMRKRVF